MASNNKIIQLRQLLAERFPQAPDRPAARMETGFAQLDDLLGGGLPQGAITELISGQPSAGSALFIAAMLNAAAGRNHFVALIDGCDAFDPQNVESAALAHLLWLRCRDAAQALKAADLLLRDGNLPLIILDLRSNPP